MTLILQLQFKITKGINQDVDVLTSTPDTAYRLYNIKTQSLDASSSNDLTNEKGNSEITVTKEGSGGTIYITGTVVGVIQCTPTVVVLFVSEGLSVNTIYRLTYIETSDTIIAKVLARGKFNIPTTTEVSGIFVFEHSHLLKIYWVDGVNPLRYLNIADSNPLLQNGKYITESDKLSSCPTVKLNHKFNVERLEGGGVFTAGVIQYAFTYYNKYGAETNIVDISPLYYISNSTRGSAADESVGCSFKVSIQNPDTSFDYIRIYSIQRTSYNGVPIIKLVNDIKING